MANSTPNYGYDSDIAAISGIDRDLKRVEDKADANGQLAVQVAVNKSDITHLDKRIDELKSAPCNTYCKEAIDCKLESRASKCEFEKHLADCDAHKKLFEQKVDKKDGCRLICEDELQQIRDDIDDRYTQSETDSLLVKKVDRKTPEEFALPITDDFTGDSSVYYKDEFGQVTIYMEIVRKVNTFDSYETFATLPEGYRPRRLMGFPAMYYSPTEKYRASTVVVYPDGKISTDTSAASMSSTYLRCLITYLAAQ